MKPTIEDVAALAGVSRGTVSRVLNGGPVSRASAERVQAAIAETGYRAHHSARSLAGGRSGVYAAVISEPYGELFEDPTFGLLLRGISSQLTGAVHTSPDVSLSLVLITDEEERRRADRLLDPRRVDGVILLSPHVHDPILGSIDPSLPVVVCGELDEPRDLTWSVTIDDAHGGAAGARHLLQRGVRCPAIIGGPLAARGALRRVHAQETELGDLLDPALLVHANYAASGGVEAMRELLVRDPGIDAVLCGSDRQAVGALQVLLESGRSVPDDVAIVGFDDQRFAATTSPPLTTINQPITEVGAVAARTLAAHLRGEEVSDQTLPTSLVIRSSA